MIVENNQDVHGVAVQIKTDTIFSGSGLFSLTVRFQSNGNILEDLYISFKHMTYEALSKSCHDQLQLAPQVGSKMRTPLVSQYSNKIIVFLKIATRSDWRVSLCT